MITKLVAAAICLCCTGLANPVANDQRADAQGFFAGIHSVVIKSSKRHGRLLRGDWETPDALLLAFSSQWSDSLLDVVAATAGETELWLLTPRNETFEEVESWLTKHTGPFQHIRRLVQDADTPWVRDYGPIQVRDEYGEIVWLDAIYDDRSRPNDDTLPQRLGSAVGVNVDPLPISYDGGALIGNGSGLCVATLDAFEKSGINTTDEVLIDGLLAKLGCRLMALVPGLVREKTGHIDMFAQFVSRDLVAVAEIDVNVDPENAARLDETAAVLKSAAAAMGVALEVKRVHMPIDHKETFFTYLNGVRLKNAFLVPSYRTVPQAEELLAYEQLQAIFGDVALVPIVADQIIELFGAVHCIAMGIEIPRRTAVPHNDQLRSP